MRLMAQRVGRSGHVRGIDRDAPLGRQAQAMLHASGHPQCAFAEFDLTSDSALPGAPYDLVYARLLLYHLPQRVDVLRRLWAAVAPGGYLLIQDYDMHSCGVTPALDSVDALVRVMVDAFEAAGCDVRAGAGLPDLFARAGIGAPDGTDVAGRLEPLATAKHAFTGVLKSVLPAAIATGIATEQQGAALVRAVEHDAELHPDRPSLWPLLISAWKRKPGPAA